MIFAVVYLFDTFFFHSFLEKGTQRSPLGGDDSWQK